ncbi:hypothetical protein AAHC03_012961 [Spirometra sp. Aus1]
MAQEIAYMVHEDFHSQAFGDSGHPADVNRAFQLVYKDLEGTSIMRVGKGDQITWAGLESAGEICAGPSAAMAKRQTTDYA